MAGRELEFELVILERAFGGYIHQLVSEFAKAEVLEIDLSEEVVAEPGQEIESDGRYLKEIVDRIVASRPQMFNGQTIFGAFDQGPRWTGADCSGGILPRRRLVGERDRYTNGNRKIGRGAGS